MPLEANPDVALRPALGPSLRFRVNLGTSPQETVMAIVGKAEGERQTYSVFEVDSGYLVAAPRGRNNYSVTFVPPEVPEVISRKFKGRRITVGTLRSQGHRADLFGEYFDRLNALYVMVALGRATKLKRKLGRAMLFKVK